jgi:hypothetical protein
MSLGLNDSAKLFFRGVFLSAAALLLAVSAWSQGATGIITGTVTDPSGASVAGAAVTATNTGTGSQKRTTTAATGL